MVKKLILLSTGILIGALCFADVAPTPAATASSTILTAPPGDPPTQAPQPLSPTSPPPDKATMGAGFNPATIYYTLGPINFITPWLNPTIGAGYDFNAKEPAEKAVTTLLCPIGNLWIFNAVGGGAVDGNGHGSPLIGGQIAFNNPIENVLPLHHVGLTGTIGYNLNEKRMLVVASMYKRFF